MTREDLKHDIEMVQMIPSLYPSIKESDEQAIINVVEYASEQQRLEEQGLLLKLPCKIGNTAYAIRDYKGVKKIQKSIISEMYYTKNMELMIVAKYVGRGKFGEKIFPTEQEAQAALEKMKGE